MTLQKAKHLLQKSSLLIFLKSRLQNRPDTEHIQALIRIILTTIFLVVYFNHPIISTLILFYLIISTLIFIWIIIYPQVSHWRKVFGIFGDIGMASSVLYFAGEAGILSLPVYLWVIVGNGFRFGVKYLRIAAIIAFIEALVTLNLGAYWGGHLWLSFVLLLTLIAVPLYISSLLQQLYTAIKTSENANRAKSQFLANMSHELRTPLNGIIGASELLTMTKLDKQQQGYANLIQSSGHTLLALIEDVLDISKIEAGKQTVEIKPFDLHILISSTLQTFMPQAAKKELTLTSHVDANVPFQLCGDELHIRQILINFIGNALKFTDKGGIKVLVELMEDSMPSKTWLKFRVIDTGIGLSTKVQSKIFESFTQADTSVTRQYGGTGLGTTISKELVSLMGGEIGLHSVEGEGSEFWFTLPFDCPESLSKEKVAQRTDFANARILTLLPKDIEPSFLTPTQRWGQEVQTCHNVVDLFTVLSESSAIQAPYHIAIVDITLLSMSAEEFITKTRKKHVLNQVAYILTGDNFDKISTEILIEQGFAEVITYPLNESLLFNAIHEICVGKDIHKDMPSIAKQQIKQGQHSGLNILVAEDNDVNQIVIREFLERMGHRVIMVDDGEQALDALEQEEQHYDLALLDINMPNMSGLDVIKAYRFLEVDTRLPMIVLSADAISGNIEECLEAGADAYLTKPIEHQRLAQAIEKLIPSKQKETAVTSLMENNQTHTHKWQYIDHIPLDKLSSMSKREHFVEGLVEKFISNSDEKISALIFAAEHQDKQDFMNTIHTLKGSSGMIGAIGIQQACNDIEKLAEHADNQPLFASLSKLQNIIKSTNQELMRYVEQRST